MALTTTNGMSIDDLSTAPNGPGLAQQLGNQVDAFYGGNVANAAALPASGKFPGQRVWLVDVKSHAVWDGAAWKYDTAWVTPTLGGSWVPFDGGTTYNSPQYKRRNGEVILRGVMKSGTGNPFTLPAGFRPLLQQQFAVVSNTGQSARIDVQANGVVAIIGYSTGASNSSLALNGIRFDAEQ